MKSVSFFSNPYLAAKKKNQLKKQKEAQQWPKPVSFAEYLPSLPITAAWHSLGEKIFCQLVCVSLCCSILHLKAGLQPWGKKCFVRRISIRPSLISTSWKTCPASFIYPPVFRKKSRPNFVLVTSKVVFLFSSWGGGLQTKAEQEEP